MLKAVLVKVHQSFVEVVTGELPAEMFVKEVIAFLRIKSLDIFQFHLVHVYPIEIECTKPLIFIAQPPRLFISTGISH